MTQRNKILILLIFGIFFLIVHLINIYYPFMGESLKGDFALASLFCMLGLLQLIIKSKK